MTTNSKVAWLFGINAAINWTVSLRPLVDPVGAALAFGGPAPVYPFIVRLWAAFVFMFGCMFWEVRRNPTGKVALVKYNWIEKTLTAAAVTLGYLAGEAPQRLMVLIVFTNWLWIPVVLWADLALRGSIRANAAKRIEVDGRAIPG
jgi:hypothetical protein